MKSRWLTAVDNDLGTFKIEFNGGMAFLHLTIRKAMEGMREAKKQFPLVKAWLRRMGHERVFVIIPEGDQKLYRFEQMFGFVEARRLKGQILMTQEC